MLSVVEAVVPLSVVADVVVVVDVPEVVVVVSSAVSVALEAVVDSFVDVV